VEATKEARGESRMNEERAAEVSPRTRAKLEEEFNRLKRVTGMGSELKLLWLPNIPSDVHGEVAGCVVKIYDNDEGEAVRTLRHEFLDYVISKQIIRPLVKQLNMQTELINDLIYARKENVIEKIFLMLEEDSQG